MARSAKAGTLKNKALPLTKPERTSTHAALYEPLVALDERYLSGSLAEAPYKIERSKIFVLHSKNPAEMEAAYARIDARRQKRGKKLEDGIADQWADYEKRLDFSRIAAFKKHWQNLQDDIQKIIDHRAVSLVAWLEAELLIAALNDYHHSNVEDGILFEDAISDAIFGMCISTPGRQKIDAWAKEAKATPKNLLWRTVALNQEKAIEELDKLLALAMANRTPLYDKAWDAILANLKTFQRLADTYKKAQTVLAGNERASSTNGTNAFGNRLKAINTRGLDKFIVTVGDRIFKTFRIDKLGELISDKIIQHVLTMRAYVDPIDSLRLVAAQAKEQKLSNQETLARLKGAERFMALSAMHTASRTSELKNAWNIIAKSEDGKLAIKDARLAAIVLLIEGFNFGYLMSKSEGDLRTRSMIAASAMTMTAAVCDILGTRAKAHWRNESATYQKLKLMGGLLGGFASLTGAVIDLGDASDQWRKGNMGIFTLYFLKGIVGLGNAGITIASSTTYGAGVIEKLAGRSATAQGARVTGGLLGRLIVGRILLLFSGMSATLILFGLQALIWVFSDNKLQNWFDQNNFGKERKGWDAKKQSAAFDEALKDIL